MSKISDVFFPLAASSFFKKTTPAIALTPPPSKEIIFFCVFCFVKYIRKNIHQNIVAYIKSINKKGAINAPFFN